MIAAPLAFLYQVCVTAPSGFYVYCPYKCYTFIVNVSECVAKALPLSLMPSTFFHLLFDQTKFKYYFYKINRYKYVADAFCLFCKSKWIVWLQKYHSFSLSQFVLFDDDFHFNDIIFALFQDLFHWLLYRIDSLHFDKLILAKKNSDKLIAQNSKVLWSHMPGSNQRISKHMHHIIFQSIWLVLNENIFIYLIVVYAKGMQSK